MEQQKAIDKALRLLVKSSFIVFLGVFLAKLFTYFYRVIIARYFGPEVYGLFALALMISGLFIALFAFGIPDGLLRFISFYRGKKENEKIKYLYQFSTKFLLISSIISAITLFFLAEFISIKIFHNENLIVFLKIFAIIVPFSIFLKSSLSTIRAFEKISWFSFNNNILPNFIHVFFLGFLIFLGVGINSVPISYLAGILISLVFAYFFINKRLPFILEKFSIKKDTKIKLKKELFSYSWPLVLLGFIGILFTWIDSFMIGYFANVSEVGIYNVAIPLANLLLIAPELFLQLFFPMINKEYSKENIEVVKQLSKQVVKWIFIINLPLLILFLFFPGVFINFFFGSQYLSAENSLRFLAIGAISSSIFILISRLLFMIKKLKLILLDVIIMSVVNIILNMILVPKYGITGAAFSTMLSALLLNLIYLVQVNYYLDFIPLRRKMLKIFLISLMPTLVLVFVRNNLQVINLSALLVLGSFYFLFYLVLIFFSNSLDKNDLMIIKSLKNKIFKK